MGEDAIPVLPETDDTLLLRTDFSDQKAWEAVRAIVETPNDGGFMAYVHSVDDPAYRNLTVEQVLKLLQPDYSDRHALLALVDKTTVSLSEMPILVLDLREDYGSTLRVTASDFWGVENNLSFANAGFQKIRHSYGIRES